MPSGLILPRTGGVGEACPLGGCPPAPGPHQCFPWRDGKQICLTGGCDCCDIYIRDPKEGIWYPCNGEFGEGSLRIGTIGHAMNFGGAASYFGYSPATLNYTIDLTKTVATIEIPDDALIVCAQAEYNSWDLVGTPVTAKDTGGSVSSDHGFPVLINWKPKAVAYLNSFVGSARKAVPAQATVTWSGGMQATVVLHYFAVTFVLPLDDY